MYLHVTVVANKIWSHYILVIMLVRICFFLLFACKNPAWESIPEVMILVIYDNQVVLPTIGCREIIGGSLESP